MQNTESKPEETQKKKSKKRKGNASTIALLRPHVGKQSKHLAAVVGLGIVTAFAQALSLPLIGLVFAIVFPPRVSSGGEVSPAGAAEEANSSVGASLGLDEEKALAADKSADIVYAVGDFIGIFESRSAILLLGLTVVALFLALIAGIAQYGYTLIGRRTGYRMIVDLRVRLAEHLMGLSMRYHGQRQFGDLLSRLSGNVSKTLNAVNLFIRSVLMEPIKGIAVFAVMIWMAPRATLVMLVVMPLAVMPVLYLSKRVRNRAKRSQDSLGGSLEALTQMILGIRTVKAFGVEQREIKRYRKLNNSFLKQVMKMVRSIALSQAWTAFFSIAGIGLMVMVIGTLELNFDLFKNSGDLAAWFLMAARLNNHVKNFTKAQTRLAEASGAADRINALLAEQPDVIEADDPIELEKSIDVLRFEDLSFTYPGVEVPAVKNLTLELKRGETLALVGPSGAGKSTLMDLVARFIDPTQGCIRVDGTDLRDVKLKSWSKQYGLVDQAPFLFHASIRENIGYGKTGASDEEIEAAARAANIHDFIEALPEGYDTDAADMGARLSGGQRQRITIARAVLKGAPILLLDEATSALDSESEAQVQVALKELMVNRTVFVIAHRLSTIRDADRIAVMEDGCLVELGSHTELIQKGGAYARLHAIQNRGLATN